MAEDNEAYVNEEVKAMRDEFEFNEMTDSEHAAFVEEMASTD